MDWVSHFITDMDNTAEYIRTQQLAGVDTTELMHRMAISRKTALDEMSFDIGVAGRITAAVVRGPWTPAQKNELATHIQTRVDIAPKRKDRRDNQECDHYENLISQSTAEVFSDPTKHLSTKANAAAAAALSFGLVLPPEKAIRRITSSIVAFSNITMNNVSLHTYHNEVKAVTKALMKHNKPSLEFLAVFPNEPEELPPATRAAAYASSPPANHDDFPMKEVDVIYNRLALRGSSKKLKEPEPCSTLSTREGAAASSQDLMGRSGFNSNLMLQNMFAAFAQQCFGQAMGGSEKPPLNLKFESPLGHRAGQSSPAPGDHAADVSS